MCPFPVSYKAGALGIYNTVLALQQSCMDENFMPPEAGLGWWRTGTFLLVTLFDLYAVLFVSFFPLGYPVPKD